MNEDDALFFETADDFELWLEANSTSNDGIWVRMAKKKTGIASLDWASGVDVALCFGWIDGKSKRVDDDWFIQRFTPRRPRSLWSKRNRENVARLTADGRMRPEGLAEVTKARADGRWDAAYDGMSSAEVPDDFSDALAAANLTDDFANLDSRNRYAILYQIQTAKRAETRTRRIEKYITMLRRGERLY